MGPTSFRSSLTTDGSAGVGPHQLREEPHVPSHVSNRSLQPLGVVWFDNQPYFSARGASGQHYGSSTQSLSEGKRPFDGTVRSLDFWRMDHDRYLLGVGVDLRLAII